MIMGAQSPWVHYGAFYVHSKTLENGIEECHLVPVVEVGVDVVSVLRHANLFAIPEQFTILRHERRMVVSCVSEKVE